MFAYQKIWSLMSEFWKNPKSFCTLSFDGASKHWFGTISVVHLPSSFVKIGNLWVLLTTETGTEVILGAGTT